MSGVGYETIQKKPVRWNSWEHVKILKTQKKKKRKTKVKKKIKKK